MGGTITNYTVTFKVTPSDATVNYSIDSETYDQTTTGTGTVSNVPHGSTIYYKISKGGYETITKSQVVNYNVTVTETLTKLNSYILVSTSDFFSSFQPSIVKYTNAEATESESIKIQANQTDYKVDNLIYGFKISSGFNCITKVDLSNFEYVVDMRTMERMFTSCNKITNLDFSKVDTSNVTTMSNMFYGCTALTSLDLSNFDTSNVTNMESMFSNCNKLTSLDLSSFDTSKVTDMNRMFSNCNKLTSLDLSSFDISKVANMGGIFTGCVALTSLDLSSFDTSKVVNKNGVFSGCNSLNHIKCKQAFKDWCWSMQDTISLPTAMRDGGGGTWEIVD